MSACPACGGTGFQIVEKEGREFAQPCACRRAGGRPAAGFVAACRIPPRYEECALTNFDAQTPELNSALLQCMRYANEYPFLGSADEGLGLLFTGQNGVGKTHLAVGVLRELFERKGAQGQFWDFNELVRIIRSSYDKQTNTTELQILQPVVECDVLLLDDLGAWKMTDWMNDTLFYVLNTRYVNKRPTVITTNFVDAPRKTAARDQGRLNEYLIDRIGDRLRSRLMQMCSMIEVRATDNREARQASNQRLLGGFPTGR